MANRDTLVEITPEVLLKAYACGIFPMAESADDPTLYWVEPDERGIMPLERFHVPSPARPHRALGPLSRSASITTSTACSTAARSRSPAAPRTWINARIRTLYRKLYEIGHCHSVEAYEDEMLVGGLYGVSLGRAFFGESMFHRATRCLEGGAGPSGGAAARRRVSPARHAVRDRSPEVHSARSRCRGGNITSCWTQALIGEADFGALPLDRPVSRRRRAELGRRRASDLNPISAPCAVARQRRRPGGGGGCTRRGCCGAARRGCGGGGAAAGFGRRFFGDRGRRCALTVGQPDIVDRMLDRVEARARSEHPAGEDAAQFALQRQFVDLDEARRCSATRSAGACSRRAASPRAHRTAPSR